MGADWTSPTGHTYTVPAATYPIDRTHDVYVRHDTDEQPAETETDADLAEADPLDHDPHDHDSDPPNDDPPF